MPSEHTNETNVYLFIFYFVIYPQFIVPLSFGPPTTQRTTTAHIKLPNVSPIVSVAAYLYIHIRVFYIERRYLRHARNIIAVGTYYT